MPTTSSTYLQGEVYDYNYSYDYDYGDGSYNYSYDYDYGDGWGDTDDETTEDRSTTPSLASAASSLPPSTTSTTQEGVKHRAKRMKAEASKRFETVMSWARDPNHRVPLSIGSLLFLFFVGMCCYCVCRCCRRRRQHRHTKLRESDESGIPPQIVGGDAADAETFVIGDDDLEEDGFAFIHDVEMAPSTPSGSPLTTSAAVRDQGLRGSANGSLPIHSNWDPGGPPDLI